MKSARAIQAVEYFEQLPDDVRDLVRNMVADTIEQVDGWKSTDETLSDVECHARSGFMPHSFNRGGIEANQFTDLAALESRGYSVSHKGAQKAIESSMECGRTYARESFYESNTEELNALGIKSPKSKKLEYHALYDMGQGRLAEELDQCVQENLSDDSSSIMFSVRFMYHGTEDGIHSASVSCAVNTEGPYHRQSIPWAPDVFCEGAKEVEIKWTTLAQLKRELSKALKLTSEKVF